MLQNGRRKHLSQYVHNDKIAFRLLKVSSVHTRERKNKQSSINVKRHKTNQSSPYEFVTIKENVLGDV